MLNEANGQGGGDAGEALKDADALFSKLKRWVKADYNSKGQVNWRREAREDFDFGAGEQLNEKDKGDLDGRKASDRCLKYPDLFKNQKFSRSVGRRLDANKSPPRQGWGPARGQSG